MPISHIIADLHLCDDRPDITAGFLKYLNEVAVEATHLYILGDFFEAWVGDDARSSCIDLVTTALSRRAAQGKRQYFCHGNRDFLVGPSFCEAARLELLDDETIVRLAGKKTLLMHGDSLCTDDRDYQAFRQMVRQADWQAQFLQQPLTTRLAIAAELRSKSKDASREKADDIMDVNTGTVLETCARHQVTCLVHGHTHRPAVHNEHGICRVVVGDWDAGMRYARADAQSLTLHHWTW